MYPQFINKDIVYVECEKMKRQVARQCADRFLDHKTQIQFAQKFEVDSVQQQRPKIYYKKMRLFDLELGDLLFMEEKKIVI